MHMFTGRGLDIAGVLLFYMQKGKGLVMGDGRIKAGALVGFICLMAMFSLPERALAFGFGALGLNSHLNEPLDAQIQILLNNSEKMDHIKIELASADEYRQMGLVRDQQLSVIRLVIEGGGSGSPVVRLNSSVAITTPLLSVVLKAKKEGRGTYYRHYQLLMDAAETSRLNDQVAKVLPVSSGGAAVPMSQPATAPSRDGSDWARSGRYGPVRAGDSLSEIAYRLRKDKRYSNRQVMLSLYEKNPSSFVAGSINHLKQGSWLDIPTAAVVKSYANPEAMSRLSVLLKDSIVEKKPAASPQEMKERGNPAEKGNQELRYSGKINFSSGARDELAREILKSVRKESDEKLETIHQQLMSSKLQMTGVSQTVTQLEASMQDIKEDVKSIKDDVSALKLQTQRSVGVSDNYWLIVLLVLLAVLLGVIAGLMLRRPKKNDVGARRDRKPENKPDPVVRVQKELKPIAAVEPKEEPKPKPPILELSLPESGMEPRPTDKVDALVNNIEASLGQCDFEDAEALLDEVDPLAPNSLRAAVLRAQLYHETGRQDECHALINRMSESSDKKRWEDFCHMLPAHVWQACFGDGGSDHG